jgi:hypothetical protein
MTARLITTSRAAARSLGHRVDQLGCGNAHLRVFGHNRTIVPEPDVTSSTVLTLGSCGYPAVLLALFAGELADVDVALAEHFRAAGQVPCVPVVDLFGLDRNRLILAGLQGLGPVVERPRVVQPE